jgi:predicted oxidoreductase
MILIFLLLLVLIISIEAIVPSLKLCDDCDIDVSRVGLGTLHVGTKELNTTESVSNWINHAYNNLGITLFDLADVYPVRGGKAGDSAKLFGEALNLTPGLREKLTLVCKMDIIFPSAVDTSTDYLQQQVNWYLESLKTTYLDIVLIHYSDAKMDANQVASFFQDLKSKGIVKNFGVSNHYPSKFNLLQKKLDKVTDKSISLVATEFECSVWNPSYMNYNSGLMDHAYSNGLHPLCWGSLAGDPIGGPNRLFDKRGTRQHKINKELRNAGEQLGIEDDDVVALLWLLSHPAQVIPLLGSTKPDRLSNQVKAFEHLGRMTNDQWWAIAGAGGLCALGDSQCNYEEYRG